MKHTAGPWREFQDADGHDIMAPDGTHIAAIETVGGMEAEQVANARLISAAPELLEALKRFLVWNDRDMNTRYLEDALTVARKAVAKAVAKAEDV